MSNDVESFKEKIEFVPSRTDEANQVRKIPSFEMTDENIQFV